MTTADYNALHARGFRLAVLDLLRSTGFDSVDDHRNDNGTTTPAFVRSGPVPQIYITLDPVCDVRDVITAIFDDGRQQGHTVLANAFMSFFDRCKRFTPAPDAAALEARIKALESKAQRRGGA